MVRLFQRLRKEVEKWRMLFKMGSKISLKKCLKYLQEEFHAGDTEIQIHWIMCSLDVIFYAIHNFPMRWKVKVLIALLCLMLCNPMDCSPTGSNVQGVLQVLTLEWVASAFSRGFSQPRDQTWISYIAGTFFTNYATRKAPWGTPY